MRIVKTAIVLLLVFSGALLAIRFFSLDQATVFILQKIGADEVRVHGLTVGFQQFHVNELAATFNLPGGDRVQAEMHDVSLQYDLQQLVTTGRANEVDIEVMHVSLIRGLERSSAPMRLPKKIILLKDSIRGRLPLEKICIKQLQFHGDLPLQFTEKNIQVNGAIRGTAFDATVTAQVSADTTVVVALQSPDSLHATARLGIQKAGSESVNVELVLMPDNLSGEVDLSVRTLQNLFFQGDDGAVLPETSGVLSVRMDIPLVADEKGALAVTIDVTDFSAQGVRGALSRIQLAGRLEAGALVFDRESRFLAKQVNFGTTEIQEISLDLAGEFKHLNEQLQLYFTDQQKIELKGVTVGKLQVANLDLELEYPLHIAIDTSQNSWSVADNVLHTGPLNIQEGTRSFESAPASCSFSGLEKPFSDLGLLAEIQMPTAVFGNTVHRMPVKELSATLQLKQKSISGELQFSPESIVGRVQASFEHDLESARGSFSLHTDKSFELNEEGARLSNVFTSWQYPFDLDSGMLAFKANGTWGSPDKLQLSVFTALTGASGYHKQFLFDGLEFRQDLAVFPVLKSKTAGSFALRHFIGGIDVYDIRSHVTLDTSTAGKLPLLEINDFSASLFGGTISTSNVQYDLNRPDSRFVVDIDTVNLETLVNLIKMDSLLVTGRISGSIPVTIRGKDITVLDGELHNVEPGGEIRYMPGAVNQSGLAAYALKAIESMQYETLTAKAEYVPSGQLDLDISLRGTSPGLQTNRPVHLNIHAEQNLPALLKSLRFSKGLTEELDKRVKQHYN